MTPKWDYSAIQSYIDNAVEENQTLDYKSSGSLAKTDSKRTEITKDVSAMANSAGGIIIYGIKEYDEPDRRHLPKAIDPVNRPEYPKEWLEHVINSIQPRINDVTIYPVDIENSPDQVVYVVEIPKSTTAHQALDRRYYRRFNFESVPMLDHEIRDVMNRAVLPDAEVTFTSNPTTISPAMHTYRLRILVRNVGLQAIDHFKFEFTFPDYGSGISFTRLSSYNHPYFGLITDSKNDQDDYVITFRSKDKLFPEDVIDIGQHINFTYDIDDGTYARIRTLSRERNLSVHWVLFADNMVPKHGSVPFSSLHKY